MSPYKGRGIGWKTSYTYIGLSLILKIIVIIVLFQTVLKIRKPKVRLGAVVVQNINSGPISSSFNIRLIIEVTIKNTNFGHFRYDETRLNILYNGIVVGQTMIPKSKVGVYKTERFALYVAISSDALWGSHNFNNNVNSGVLFLTSQARVSGKVRLIIWKKEKKSPELSCAITINLATQAISELACL